MLLITGNEQVLLHCLGPAPVTCSCMLTSALSVSAQARSCGCPTPLRTALLQCCEEASPWHRLWQHSPATDTSRPSWSTAVHRCRRQQPCQPCLLQHLKVSLRCSVHQKYMHIRSRRYMQWPSWCALCHHAGVQVGAYANGFKSTSRWLSENGGPPAPELQIEEGGQTNAAPITSKGR